MKKVFAVILSVLMLFSFAACGGEGDGTETTTEATTTGATTTTANDTTTTAEPSGT